MKASEKKSRLVQDLKARVKELEENQEDYQNQIADLQEARDKLRDVIEGIGKVASGSLPSYIMPLLPTNPGR